MEKPSQPEEEHAKKPQAEENESNVLTQPPPAKRQRLILKIRRPEIQTEFPPPNIFYLRSSSSSLSSADEIEADEDLPMPSRTEYTYYKVLLRPLIFDRYRKETDLVSGRERLVFEPERICQEAMDRVAAYDNMEVVETLGMRNGFVVRAAKGVELPFTERYWAEKVQVKAFEVDEEVQAAEMEDA